MNLNDKPYNRELELAKIRAELIWMEEMEVMGFHQVVEPGHTIVFVTERPKRHYPTT